MSDKKTKQDGDSLVKKLLSSSAPSPITNSSR